jgi:outer membrane protein TolC
MKALPRVPNPSRVALALFVASTLVQAQQHDPQPIDLPTALRLAHAQNIEVQIARQKLEEAKALRAGANERFMPWLSVGAAYTRHEGQIQAVEGPILDVDKQAYTVGPTLAAQVVLGDAIYKSLAAKQQVVAAGHALEAQQEDSSLAAAQAYYELARTAATLDVIRESLRISQDYQKQVHEAVSAGIAFKGDELRAQVQTEHYQVALRQGAEQQRLAAARLAVTLHLDASTELVPQNGDLVPIALVETNAALDSLVQRALRSRSEIKQSEALVASAKATKNGSVYGPLIPTLGAQVFAGGLGGGPNDSMDNFGRSDDYFVGLNWRFGPGGIFDFANVHATKARLELSKLASERVNDEIISQVVESHVKVQSLQDQIVTQLQSLTTASEALRLTRERKQFGVGAVLEDIQAQQDLTRARSDYVAAVAEYNKAQFALSRAVGPQPSAQSK